MNTLIIREVDLKFGTSTSEILVTKSALHWDLGAGGTWELAGLGSWRDLGADGTWEQTGK